MKKALLVLFLTQAYLQAMLAPYKPQAFFRSSLIKSFISLKQSSRSYFTSHEIANAAEAIKTRQGEIKESIFLRQLLSINTATGVGLAALSFINKNFSHGCAEIGLAGMIFMSRQDIKKALELQKADLYQKLVAYQKLFKENEQENAAKVLNLSLVQYDALLSTYASSVPTKTQSQTIHSSSPSQSSSNPPGFGSGLAIGYLLGNNAAPTPAPTTTAVECNHTKSKTDSCAPHYSPNDHSAIVSSGNTYSSDSYDDSDGSDDGSDGGDGGD